MLKGIKEKLNWLRYYIIDIEVYKKEEEQIVFLTIYLFCNIRVKLIEFVYFDNANVVNFIQVGILK